MGCYRLYKESKNSADAKQQCANDGGRLLLINSAAEFTKLVSLLSKHYLNKKKIFFQLEIHTKVKEVVSIVQKTTCTQPALSRDVRVTMVSSTTFT